MVRPFVQGQVLPRGLPTYAQSVADHLGRTANGRCCNQPQMTLRRAPTLATAAIVLRSS